MVNSFSTDRVEKRGSREKGDRKGDSSPCALRRLTKMGQDYSYSQPSSSSESLDITSLLEAECQIYGDEADSSYCNSLPVQYPRQPEADDGMNLVCL